MDQATKPKMTLLSAQESPAVARRRSILRTLPRFSAALVVLVGLTTLAGWLLHVEALKSVLVTLRDNPALRMKAGASGRKAYEEKYSWSIMEKRLLDSYREA